MLTSTCEEQMSIEAVLQEVCEELEHKPYHNDTYAIKYWHNQQWSKASPLQLRYDRQVASIRNTDKNLLKRMSNMLAWTWIPGKNRHTCPSIVQLRDARLLVMDRFPDNHDDYHIGLSMYRTTIDAETNEVIYASPDTMEMFKDFSNPPSQFGTGLVLDANNDTVFKTALALDHALELTAKFKLNSVETFIPPQLLFGFPYHFRPSPEWRAPMQEAVRNRLSPSGRMLNCLLSPGGLINKVIDLNDGFRLILMERLGQTIQIKLPIWIKLNSLVRNGNIIADGVPLGDLPRNNYSSIREITSRFSFRSLEWLQRRILDEYCDILTVEEDMFDKNQKCLVKHKTNWCCVPAQFVFNQIGRAMRFFIDFRSQLGRINHTLDSFEKDVWSENQQEVQINVINFNNQLKKEDFQFSNNNQNQQCKWRADFATQPQASWLPITQKRFNNVNA